MAIIRGTSGNDDILGTSQSDTIYGYAGDDIILGGGGNDLIYGDAGQDDIYGGAGVNDLFGGAHADWFIMSARSSAASDDYIGDMQLGIDKIDVSDWGVSSFSQLVSLLRTDDAGDAYLNAAYNGRNHFLTIADVAASELIGSDFVFSDSGARNITATAYGDTVFGSRSGDTLNGAGGADHIDGGIGSDILIGGTGNDRLIGGDGGDRLTGGSGADRMSGGSGSDIFAYTTATESAGSTGRDTIADFQEDIDLISLTAIDANAVAGGNQHFSFIGQSTGFSGIGQLAYSFSGANTIVRGNTDNDSAAEFEVVITGRHHMIADDFYL